MLSRDKGMNSAFFASIVIMDETWMPMFNPETKWKSAQWKHTDSPPPKKFRVTISAEKMMVAMFRDSEGVILIVFPRVQQWWVRLKKMWYERSFFQHCVKNGPKRLQLCSLITKTLLLIGRLGLTSFSSTTTLKLFLTLRTHLTSHQVIFGCFQHWRTLFMVTHFQVIPLLQQRFSSGHNEPLKKRLLWPCNRGISIVKNVYVYRMITLRNDCIFSFLGWVIVF